MKLTSKWLAQGRAEDGLIKWFESQSDTEGLNVVRKLIADDPRGEGFSWANWLIVRMMSYEHYVSYAVLAAEQVIDIYEAKYGVGEPRDAIEAAKKCIDPLFSRNDTNKKTAEAAAEASAEAALAAEYDAATTAGGAAWAAAYAAHAAARDAAGNAGGAAWAFGRDAEAAGQAAEHAVWTAAWAAADVTKAAARADMQRKIIQYGISLLERE